MHSNFRPAARVVAGLATALALAPAAQAALRDTIVVTLEAPDFHSPGLVQAAPLATGVLAANLGGLGDISVAMVDDESIRFDGDAILIRVGSASDSGLTTGWGSGARYLISGIGVEGAVITGVDVLAYDGFGTSGTSGLAAGAAPGSFLTVNADYSTIVFALDDSLQFLDRGNGSAGNYAEFRIDLLSQPVPEPAQWLLMAGGLAGLLLARRRAGQA
jgi:PEP-CTERM motif